MDSRLAESSGVKRGDAAGREKNKIKCDNAAAYLSSSAVTVLSSVTLYIMDGSSETFSMNMGEVVMFWI